MANLHFTTILLLCHTLLRLNGTGQTTSSSFSSNTTMSTTSSSAISTNTSQASKGIELTVVSLSKEEPASKWPQTSTSIPSSTTPPPAQGQTASSITMSTPMSISSTNTSPAGGGQPSTTNPVPPVAPQTSTSTPSSTTPPPAQGQLTYSTSMPMSAVSMSPTSTFTIAPSSSTSPQDNGVGAQVNVTIYVGVSTCSGASYEDVSSPEYRDLERNLKGNLTVFYTRGGVSFMLKATLQAAQCTGNYVKVVVKITFKPGIPFTIEVDIKAQISGNFLGNLRVDGARVEVAFIGVRITFEIKEGECKRVCCDGPGGQVYMVSSCKPQDGNNDSCDGFKSEEKQEDDHCPGEANDLCSSTCDSTKGDRASSVQCPSFALVGLLPVATFFK
ncbi:location of vulva defective 1-like [Acropora millepora]|uniref:location of vulva defective 1-like n=1 Tax=Acropora millepora TaxID=45264 RepID=UPI001CF5597C|nr:location of vulva defective 1-like [Acropora millepora]